MKAVLLQLPVQSHDYGYSLENIPLAGGYLKVYAQEYLRTGMDVEICPPDIASFGGDAAVLDWIGRQSPDVVGFSCYLWNIERSLDLCRRIRERSGGDVKIVLGGPEISPDNPLLEGALFDAAVEGEGEETFADLLASWSRGSQDISFIPGLVLHAHDRVSATGRRRLVPSLDSIPSPYLSKAVDHSITRTIFLETVRGCVYRCSYCSYHKQFGKLRLFGLDRTASEVRLALENGIEEISFIDPCFARRPDLNGLLAVLKDAQSIREMKISCELNAEDLDRKKVDGLVRAGLRHVEIGLQSTNPKALKMCGRRFDEALFTRGIRMLKSCGVHVDTDIMVGLPGDRAEDVKNTIDFVLQNGLFDTLNLFPVSVLPNTILREQAGAQAVSYQERPPYYVTGTREMTADDMRSSFAYAERVTGESYFPVELPFAGKGPRRPGRNTHVGHILISRDRSGGAVHPEMIGQALAIEIDHPAWLDRRESLRNALLPLLQANPSTLLSWIIPDEMFHPDEALPFLRSFTTGMSHPCDREYMSTGASECSVQVFIMTCLGHGSNALTQVPLRGAPSRLRSFLPEHAGAAQEEIISGRLEKMLGRDISIEFHDAPRDRSCSMDIPLRTAFVKI